MPETQEIKKEKTLPKGWELRKFEDVLDYIQPTLYIVESTDYSDDFKTPVLTAGKSFILGRTNEESGIFDAVPVIIFDDFTTANKLVDFKFKVKSSAMKILKPKDSSVNLKFVYYYMQTVRITFDTHKRYWISEFSKLPVPYPLQSEQHRIVEKIEELFSELDYAITTLKTAQQQLQTYRQSVLKHAFEGHFTGGVEGWKEVKLGTLIKDIKYGTSQKCTQEIKGLPVLRIPNVIAGEVSIEDLKYAEFSTEEIKQLSLIEGDILIIRSNGSIGIVGKAAKVTKKVVGYLYAGYLIRIRPDKNLLNSDYANYLFQSRIIRDQIESKAKSTSGVNNVNAKELQDLNIPIFDLTTQNTIVEEIETRLSESDYLLQTINQQLIYAERLRQSILQRAFSGEL